uniref:Uncharacterized protein n=1 Tax=Rhizophora mucronata TaxID=61149 RepID=A0A2P2Q8F6_RHIMU
MLLHTNMPQKHKEILSNLPIHLHSFACLNQKISITMYSIQRTSYPFQ